MGIGLYIIAQNAVFRVKLEGILYERAKYYLLTTVIYRFTIVMDTGYA